MNNPDTTAQMRGKVCLVTGATSGLGLVTAKELGRAGATVILVGRDRDRCEAAVAAVRAVGGQDVSSMLADLSSLAEVRRLADEFKRSHPRLHVLVNNAGLNTHQRELTVDGLERQFAVNHLAPFLLTCLLRAPLAAAAPSRVITVASSAEAIARMNFDDLMGERKYNPNDAYCQSKLANVLFNYELARRFAGTGIAVNAMEPGMVGTNLKMPVGVFGLVAKMMKPFMATTPEVGADTIVWLATAPEVEGVSGKFFSKRKPVEPSKRARDADAARRLWEISEQLTGLRPARAA